MNETLTPPDDQGATRKGLVTRLKSLFGPRAPKPQLQPLPLPTRIAMNDAGWDLEFQRHVVEHWDVIGIRWQQRFMRWLRFDIELRKYDEAPEAQKRTKQL